MDFLTQQNQRVADKKIKNEEIWATDKNVVVIGGGDTGSDCVGTSNRHKAKSVTQIEILTKPPTDRTPAMPWPNWPMILRTSSSHEEGCDRHWSIVTKEFVGDAKGNLKGLKIVDVEWKVKDGKSVFEEVKGSEREIPCELALLAMGFLYPQRTGLLQQLGVDVDEADEAGDLRVEDVGEVDARDDLSGVRDLRLEIDGGARCIRARRALSSAFLRHIEAIDGHNLPVSAMALCKRTLITVSDVQTDARFSEYRDLAALGGFRAALAAPLALPGGQLLGVLSAYFPQAMQFSAWHVQALLSHAEKSAAAIDWAVARRRRGA